MDREKKIYVFADFLSFKNELIGTIYVSQTRGKEFYSFEYEQEWIEQGLKRSESAVMLLSETAILFPRNLDGPCGGSAWKLPQRLVSIS